MARFRWFHMVTVVVGWLGMAPFCVWVKQTELDQASLGFCSGAGSSPGAGIHLHLGTDGGTVPQEGNTQKFSRQVRAGDCKPLRRACPRGGAWSWAEGRPLLLSVVDHTIRSRAAGTLGQCWSVTSPPAELEALPVGFLLGQEITRSPTLR